MPVLEDKDNTPGTSGSECQLMQRRVPRGMKISSIERHPQPVANVRYNSLTVISGALYGVGLRPLASRGCGFESHRGHGCLSLSLLSMLCVIR